jgi:molecular chaperone GrpE
MTKCPDYQAKTALAIFLTGLPLPARMNIPFGRAVNLKKMAEKPKNTGNNDSLNNDPGIDINTDENLSGTTHLNEPVEEGSEMEKLKAEIGDLKDKFLRKVAEFENFRKRSAKERLEMMQTAGRDVITDLLDVLDDCDRAQKQLESSNDPVQLREGVMLVFNKLRNSLQVRGVKTMDTLNKDFDPELHEAITEVPVSSEEQKGKIVDEIMKGYYMNDKIIRHAKVIVGK